MVVLGIGAPIVQVYHEKSFILPDVSRVLACLYEKDVKFETHTASYKSLLRLQASSHAPVPFYDGPTFLEESREICRYIAEKYEHQGYPFLLGKDALERASVEQWLHNEEHAFNPPSRALFCHLAFPLGEEEDDDIDIHTRKLEEVLEVYEQRLSDSEFLVGNKFTLADLVHLPNSHYIKASNKFLYLYDSRKNVRRWWDAISDRDSWKKVLRYMKRVEEQNKQELKKQQQEEEEEEDPRTSADSIRLDPRKQIRTEPRTILVPPIDTMSSSSIVPRTTKPLPSDTSPDELLISSSHSTPAADKTSAVQSKETTIFTNPQETPPTSVQSTPVTSKKHSIPVQSTKHATSPTTAKKPPITDAAKSRTKDASILESSSSKDVSSDLDVFDHYPSHTDVDTPYIEPTTRKTSETLDAFPGSNIGTGYTKTSSISAREEPDQPTASDFYKSDSTGTSVDSRFKESVPYSGRTPPELEPTDTSASKLHTTDVHRRLQVEQWHSAKTGLNDLKHDDADHLVSTQQGKPRKDVQQYPSQDSEQATSHSVPQEPMSRDVLSQLEDHASSDQRGALMPPSTQEHGVTPSREAAAKDAHRRISSQAAYPGGQDTSKQPRDHGFVPRQGEPQDAREIFDESQSPDSTISSERFSYTSQSSLPRQDLDGARHATAPFETRYPGAEDTSKQAKDKISTPWQMTDHDAGDVKEETKVSESSSFQVEPSYFERADTPSWKQETIDDTFKETRYHSVAPPSQTRYQTPPSKARYPTAEDASKQPRGTAPTPKKQVAQDDNDTSEESKTADEVASTEQPLDAWRSPVSPRRQKVEDSSRSDTSFQKRYPYDEEDILANTASVSWQIAPDGDKNIFEETKVPDSTPTSAKPVYTPRAPFPPPRQAEVKDAKDKGRQSRVTIPESQKMVSEDAQTTHGERKTGTPGEQSSDRLQAIPQSRPPAAKGLSTKEEITNEQTVVPPLLSNEPSSRVQPASESLQEVASRGGLSTKPSTIEQWQHATVPLNDISSSSGDGEIGAETPGVQSASPSFPGASTARHATSDDKFGRQSIIDERVGEPTKILPTPYSAPAHTKRETPDGHEIVDSELVSTPDRHISEVAKIRQDQATVHEDVHDDNLSAHDVAKDTFKEAKVAESTPSSAKPMYSQQPAPTPRHAEMEDTWDKGMKGREAVPDRQQMLEKWAGTAGEQVSDRWKASAPSRQAAAEDVRGATGDTIQSPDVLDPSKKSRGAFEEAKGPGSVKEEKTSSIYQKKPLVAQDSQEQAQTIPAGEKADGSIRKHQQASDAPTTFVEKLDASEPARVKTHGDFSAEQPSRKDTTDDQKVAPPLSTRELTSQVQPPSEPSYDAALHRDLSSKPSTIYQWQLSSVPLHDVTSSSGDEVAKSTVDEKPTPMSQQKSDEQRAEPPVPIEAEIPDVQQASPSFPGASMDDRATIDDEFAMQSIIDQRVGEPTQMQTSSPDAHPASEPTKRGTPEGHEIGHLELVSTPGGQISEAKKARDDPARADIHDGHSAEEQYKKYTVDDQKVALSLSSKEPTSQVQPASEPLQRAVPDGDLPSKSFTIDQWQRTAAPLHGVITDSGDDEAAKSSNNDQKARPMSQEATPSSQSVNQMAKQSGEQSVEPPVPIVAEASDVARAAPSLPEAARADGATISDKFTEQSHIDERVGKPKQMQAPITAARPDSAPTLRRTPDSHEAGEFVSAPEGQRLEGAKATRDPATIHEDVYDASLSTHDAAIDEKTATDHASGDEVVTGSLHDHQTPRPASIQVQPTVETPHDSDSFQYVHTGDSGKAELAKPTVTDQEATVPAAGPTSADPQRADIIPAGVAHSEQKSTPSDKGSARAAQHPSPVEPIKADSNVSAANYTNAPQMIFRQQARPPAPSTIAIRTPDTQGVIGKIQEVTPDNRGTDDSGKPFVPNQEHVSHASEAIPGQEEMTSPQGARVFPTSDTQLSSADVHEVTPDGQLTVESITPLVSSGKQGSHVRSPFKPGEVGPAEKKFVPSDEESPHSSEESISGEPRKEKTVIPSAEQTTAQPTIIGRQDIPDRKQALTSEDTLNKTATHDDVHRTGTIEPARRPLSVEGEELTPATQAPSPSVARDSFHTELENVQSVKPSATPDAHDITPSSAPGEAALAEQKSASSGQGSADPAQPAFSLGPRNEEIRDSSPSAMLISSTDPSKGDPMVAVRDQAKDSQTTPGQQDILSTEHPSGKVQENIPGDNLGKAKPSRPSSAIQEGKPSKASASGIQLGSVPNELSVDEQKFAPPEPRSKEIGDLAPSTQLDSTTDPRNKDVIVAAPDQTTDSQTTPGRQVKFSAPTSQGPLGKLQEDEPADDSGEKKSSKPTSVVREGKPAAAVPVSAPDTQHGAAPDQVAVEQKFSPSGQDSVHSVQTSFSTEPTKEDTVVAPTDQTSTLERTVDQNYMTTAADKAKTPFSGTPDASSKTQKSIEDDHIDEKLPSQGQVSPDRHVSESPQGRSPEAHSDVVDKETTLGSSEAETSRTGPGSTSISADGRLSSSDMRAAGSLPETQDLQDSASAQNVLTDSLGKIESPGHVSTDQAMAPTMSPSLPSVAPLGTVPGTNSVQPPRQASTTSTVDLESVPDTQNGIPQGKATPGEQKSAISDQEPAHTTERPSSTEPRKEEANTAAGDQPNVTQGPETTVRHQAKAPPPDSREALQKYQQPSHAVLPSDIRDEHTPGVRSAIVDKETTQTSVNEPNSTPTRGDVLPTRSVQNQEAQPPPATQAPTSQGLQDSAFSQNDSSGNIKSPRQASTDQIVAPAINSAAPTGAPQGNEPGPDSSQYVQSPFSTEPTKEDTVVTAADQAEDMQTITHQQAITPAPDTAKPPFPGARDASRKFQESTPDDGPVEDYSPKPAAHTQPPAATLDVSPPYASSKAKSTEQGAKPPTGYQASSPETQLGSSQTQGEAAPAEQKFAVSDEKSVNASKSVASAEPREEDTDAATADQTSVPPTNVTRQVTSSTPDASDALSRDQESSPDDGQIRNLGSPLIASQEEASRAGRASEGSTPKVHSAIVDEKRTLPSSQAQTSSTGPDSAQIGGDARLSGAGTPATSSMEKQEAEPAAATQAPTSKGLQDSGNIESPRQASTDPTVTPAMNSAAPSDAPEGTEPGPDSSRSVQTPFSTEPTKEDTIVTAADQAEDMQTITHQQAITPAPDTAKPPFPGARDASRKFQESTPDDGPVEDYSPKPAAHTQPPAATLDVSPPYASSKAKSTGQGAKPPTGYQASSPETQLGSSQTQGEAAPAEQKFAVSDEKSVNASKSVASAEPREEDTDAATADQTSVPPTNVTRQVTSSTPDASDALSRDQESSPDDGQIRNLGSPLIASQQEASRAGRASEGSTPKVHSAIVDEKRTLPSSQAQTSSTGPDSAQIGGDARLSGAGTPATSSMEKQEAEPAAATQAPTSKGLQDSGNIESPTDPTVTPAMNSAAPSDAPEGTEPGLDSSRSVQTPFSTEPTKEDTIVTAADQAEDMQTITHQQAITPAPDTAKPPFPGARDASRKFQESTPDDGPVEDYSPKPAAHTQPPAATLDVSPPYASSKAKSTGQGAKQPTGYQASSPETQLGSSQTQGEAAPAEQKFAVSDEKSVNASKSVASAEPREEDTDAATADQTSVPPTNVTRQVTSSTPDASDALSRDQESSPDDGQIRNLGSPLIASQQEASRAGRASEGSSPKVHSAIVDEKRTLPSSQAQTSSTGPDSAQIGGDARLSGAGTPATSSMEKQEAEPAAATQAPTSKGLQDSGNIESPTDPTVTPAMNSAAPSDAPEGTEPGLDSSRSVQTPFSTEPTKEDTIVTAADQAEDMQTITHQQAITPAPDTAKPPFPGARDASRKFQESTPDDGPVEDYSPKPAAHTQPPAATLDVSPPYASSKAKSTGQGAKQPTGYQASSPETQLGSSQTQGEAAPAEQKFAVSDEKSVNASKSVASAEPREEDTDAATADQTSVPPTNVTRQVTSSTPDASDALSRDQESSPDDGQIRNLGSPLIASQQEASRAGRASEGSSPKVHSAIVDEKRTLPSSQAQTSSTGPDSAQIGGDARLSGAGTPATSSMEKQEAEPAAATQAPTSKGLQDSGNIESPTDPTVTPAMNSAAPSDAPEGTEPGPDSSRSVQTPFSTEPTKEDTIVTAADQAEDMQTITHQQAITPAPDTAKPPFPGARDASRKFQESTPDDGPVEDYSPKPAAHTQPPAATLDVSPPYASSKAKSTGQGAKPPTGYQASSPETQLGSSQTQGEAAPAEQKFAVSDEKSVNASKSVASAEPREEDTDAATADQTSVPPTNVTRQVTSSTPDASDALSRDQESSTDDGQIRNLGSPLIASQEEASRAGRASEGSTPKVHSAIVDEKRTLPSSQAQTSSTGPDSAQIGGDARLSGAGTPATSSMEKQEAEPAAATQAPTSKGLQDSGNIESPRQASTDPTVTPAMNSAAPSDAPEGTEPGPDSSRSVQTPFSTEPTKEDTIVTAADQAEDMQTITHQQAITPAPDTDKPPFSGAQDASRKFQESTPDDGHIDEPPRGSSSEPREGQTFGPYRTNVDEKTTTFASSQANISDSGSDLARTLGDVVPSIVEGPAENYSPKPGAQTQLPAAVQDVSFDASSKAKLTGQAAKAPTGYLASSPDTQLGSSQTQGEAAPAEEKLPVSGMHSVQLSKGASFDVLSNEKTTMTQDQVNTLPNGDLSSNQVVEQSESLDSKGVNSGRNLEGASTNEESKVQLQSEDNTQGHGTDAPSLETDHPSNGGLPANSYQNNSSQSQAEASNKSIEQSSPGIRNKDGDSSRLDDSTDPTKPET